MKKILFIFFFFILNFKSLYSLEKIPSKKFSGCNNEISKEYFVNIDKTKIKKIEIDINKYKNWTVNNIKILTDIANTKIELLYGLSENLQIGFSRESLKKTYALNAKYNITTQSSKLPFTSSLYASYNYNSSLDEDIYPNLSSSDRSLFFGQLLLSKSFSDKISLQLSPSFARKGFAETIFEQENNFILEILGGAYFTGTDKIFFSFLV